jgi:uncharacterized protein (TIGR02001 family)
MKSQGLIKACAAGMLLCASVGSTSVALADSPHSVSANIGAVSNYIWRGVTQTGDQAAVQGGLDYAHSSGFYAGTWISNIDNIDWGDDSPGYELDLYAGYGGSVNDDFSYDISTIYYAYPDGRDSDFWEIGASGTYKWFTLGLQYTVSGENDGDLYDDGDIYYYGTFEYGDLPYGLGFNARAGYTDFRHDDVAYSTVWSSGMWQDVTETADYWHFGASITKDAGDFGTFSLNWDQNNGKQEVGYDTDPKFWVGWLKEF